MIYAYFLVDSSTSTLENLDYKYHIFIHIDVLAAAYPRPSSLPAIKPITLFIPIDNLLCNRREMVSKPKNEPWVGMEKEGESEGWLDDDHFEGSYNFYRNTLVKLPVFGNMHHLTSRALAYNFLSWHQLKFVCQTRNDNLTAMEKKVSKSQRIKLISVILVLS